MSLQKIAHEYNHKLKKKSDKTQEMSTIMDTNKLGVSKEIDAYFDALIKGLNDRRNKLKEDYIQIEQIHRKRVIRSSLKLKALTEELSHAISEIELGINDFGIGYVNKISHRKRTGLYGE